MSSCYILSDLHIDRWNYGWTVGDGGGMYIKMGGQQIFSNYGQGFYGKIVGSAKRGLGWTVKSGATYGHPYVVYFIEILRNDIVG